MWRKRIIKFRNLDFKSSVPYYNPMKLFFNNHQLSNGFFVLLFLSSQCRPHDFTQGNSAFEVLGLAHAFVCLHCKKTECSISCCLNCKNKTCMSFQHWHPLKMCSIGCLKWNAILVIVKIFQGQFSVVPCITYRGKLLAKLSQHNYRRGKKTKHWHLPFFLVQWNPDATILDITISPV